MRRREHPYNTKLAVPIWWQQASRRVPQLARERRPSLVALPAAPATVGRMRYGAAAVLGRMARFMVLACTLLGLAAMHTIGHGIADHGVMDHGLPGVRHVATTVSAMAAGDVDDCAADGCGHAVVAPHTRHGGMGDWALCVAVLSALAVAALLVALLLRAATGRRAADDGGRRRVVAPRGPPALPYGLSVAAMSVLRV